MVLPGVFFYCDQTEGIVKPEIFLSLTFVDELTDAGGIYTPHQDQVNLERIEFNLLLTLVVGNNDKQHPRRKALIVDSTIFGFQHCSKCDVILFK